jgi:PleD family two-component response regulator
VTVTLGCTSARKEDTAESIVERVDRLLYRGKEEGRGCVVSDFGNLAV